MKKELNRFVKHVLLFIPVAMVSYILLICVWGEFAPRVLKKNLNNNTLLDGHMLTRLKEAKQTKNVDILFLGSSHAFRGFDTRIFNKHGIRSFNLGSSSQTPIQTRLLLERYLDSINPKLIVLEVYPVTFTLDGVESAVDIIENEETNIETIEMALKLKHVKLANTLIYAIYSDLIGNQDKVREEIRKGNDTYIPGGYVQKDLAYHSPGTAELYPKELDLNPDQLKAFEDVISIIDEHDIEMVLVQAPITQVNYKSFLNYDDFDELMENYGPYYNFNELMNLDDSLHFYDPDHLNSKGVSIFNEQLIRMIPEIKELSKTSHPKAAVSVL